jgi:hypothetical protein
VRGTIAEALPTSTDWTALIPDGQWSLYRDAIRSLRERGVRVLLGGAFGYATYTGIWRNTKDLDIYVHPDDRPATVAALASAGFEDYHDRKPYDRGWIYRSVRENVIVDAIWSMANRRASVDEEWFRRARPVRIREEEMRAVSPEELIWAKIYIIQNDRCDWPDILNLLHFAGPTLDWMHLLGRLEGDRALLAGLLSVYRWLLADEARAVPPEVLEALSIVADSQVPATERRWRADLLDRRTWIPFLQQEGKPSVLPRKVEEGP